MGYCGSQPPVADHFSARLPDDLRHLRSSDSPWLAFFVDALNLPLGPGDGIFGGRSSDRLGVHIGNDVVIDDDLCLRVWGGGPRVQMRVLADRFEGFVFRIDVPDGVSLEFLEDGMIIVVARGDVVDVTFLIIDPKSWTTGEGGKRL